MNERKRKALQAIAERGGTPAERELAKEILARTGAETDKLHRSDGGFVDLEDLAEELGRGMAGVFAGFRSQWVQDEFFNRDPFQQHSKVRMKPQQCACGWLAKDTAEHTLHHAGLSDSLRRKFPCGATAYYNHRWLDGTNRPVKIIDYMTWNEVELLLLDIGMRTILPAISPQGIHLSSEPLDAESVSRIRT